jgi:hypothetical protein
MPTVPQDIPMEERSHASCEKTTMRWRPMQVLQREVEEI